MMKTCVFFSIGTLTLLACGDSGGTSSGGGGGGTGGATTAVGGGTTTSATTSGGGGGDACEEAWTLAEGVATELGCMGTPMADPCPNIRSMAEAAGCLTEYQTAYECVVTQTVAANMECKPATDTVGYITMPCPTESAAFTGCLGG